MQLMKSSNPMLNSDRIAKISREAGLTGASGTLSVRGTAGRFGILTGLCIFSAFGSVAMHLPYGLALLGMLAAAVSYWVAVFVPRLAQYLSPVYAVGEGMMLGLFSAYAETRFPGVVMIALVATLCDCAAMFFAFATGFIQATERLKSFLFISGIGLMITYFGVFILNLITGNNYLTMGDHSILSIGVSIFAVIVSSLFLILDFDNVLRAEGMADKKMEWFYGMGLLATIIWMYVEIVSLLVKLYGSSND